MSVALRGGLPQLFQVFNYPVESIFSFKKRYCYSCNILKSCATKFIKPPGGRRGVTRVNFSWVCAAGLSEPLPHYSLFCQANMLFSRSQLSHFLFLWIDPFFRLNEEHFTFHLQYKHSGTFANHQYTELSYPKKSENVRPHYSQSSREMGPQPVAHPH